MAKKGISMNIQRNNSLLMKRIPLHYQKKLTNISNGSFNATFMTGVYKNKIKTLLRNNRILAVALQNDRSKKEELLEENKANANLITFSRLNLTSLSDNLKQVVQGLDETLALLELHSSVCSTKFTPKHTLSREEFKEQVKEVFMDSIPEEPESPQNNSKEACLNKKRSEDVSPGFQVDILNKVHELSEIPTNSRKTSKRKNLNEKKSMQRKDKTDIDTINYSKKKCCKTTTPVNNFDESSPAKKSATQFKKFSNKNNFISEVYEMKAETKSATTKKGRKVTKNAVCDESKRVICLNEDTNIRQNSGPSKNKPYQSKLCNDIQIFDDIQIPKSNSKKENECLDSACILKNCVSPSKLHDIVNKTKISDRDKENVSPYKIQKLSTRKFKSLGEFEMEPTITKRNYRSSALQSLSSKINIENFKSRADKGKKPEIDDLITIKQRSATLKLVNNSPKSCDTSKSYLQDLSLHRQEMVRNLAENTFLVTADVHKNPEPRETDKVKLQKDEMCNLKQPIVLVKDIFQHGKSFCKSISYPACDELNGIPLELQLLEHCSSLKMIPEESNHSQDSDTSEKKVPTTKLRNIEPSLSVEGEFIEQPLSEEKRTFRKRSASINYKELTVKSKLRR